MSVYRVGGNKSSQNVFPSVRPTLDLDFANSKTLDPRITFTRASGGSYIGADGLIKYAGVNEPRFTHDQNTGESLGLMIEDSGTNIALRSEEFDNAYWSKNNVTVIPNAAIAPDGTLSADKIVQNNLFSTFKFIARNPVGTINGNHTLSVFLKAGESYRGYIQLIGPETNAATFFDLSNGIITDTSGTIIRTITPYPNGWYRISCGLSFNNEAAVFYMVMLSNTGTSSYTGDGTSGFYVWGAQVEANSFPTSYIPTQASTRTRARDNTEISGKNFTDFYNQNGGTVYSDITLITARGEGTSNNSFDRTYSFTNSNFNVDGIDIAIFKAGTQRFYIFAITENGVDLGSTIMGTFTQYPRAKTCVSYGIGNLTAYLNNNKAPQVFPTKLITCDRLFLGKPQRFQATPYIIISRFTYYPRQLPEEQIRALTR